jgi:hypothetical protein
VKIFYAPASGGTMAKTVFALPELAQPLFGRKEAKLAQWSKRNLASHRKKNYSKNNFSFSAITQCYMRPGRSPPSSKKKLLLFEEGV